MRGYSESIVDAMVFVDSKIALMNPQSINRERLHSKVNTQLVAKVKSLASLNDEDFYKNIDEIFKAELNAEIIRCH